MKRVDFLGVLLLLAVLQPDFACAAGLSGRYVADTETGLVLELTEASDGAVTGTLSKNGSAMPVNARRGGAGFSGTVGSGSEVQPLTAAVDGNSVAIDIGTQGTQEHVTFTRAEGPQQATAPDAMQIARQRNVVINGQRLSDAELASAEQTHRIQIPDANYWYDIAIGAWGVQGGPTLGFIAPGLTLGGTLQPDAAGGGTAVFVNGRELHPYDLASLQQMTGQIAPGRYFITAQGLAGYEGGEPVYDLKALSTLGGGSGSWKSRLTGASGFSDGTTGAVFLPNGGIVSTGN